MGAYYIYTITLQWPKYCVTLGVMSCIGCYGMACGMQMKPLIGRGRAVCWQDIHGRASHMFREIPYRNRENPFAKMETNANFAS